MIETSPVQAAAHAGLAGLNRDRINRYRIVIAELSVFSLPTFVTFTPRTCWNFGVRTARGQVA